MIARTAPTGVALRGRIYEGEIFLVAPTASSLALVGALHDRLVAALGDDLRHAHLRHDPTSLFRHVCEIRRELETHRAWLSRATEVLASIGLDPREFAFDPPRVRAIQHGGHDVPAAAPAYFAHRDTWYGNPQSQINVWIPLHDANEDETFVFYPDLFSRPVENDSSGLDLDAFVRRAGWRSSIEAPDARTDADEHQREAKDGNEHEHEHEHEHEAVDEDGHEREREGMSYPGSRGDLPAGLAEGFACRTGEILLFSAAHLHQSRRITTGRTRYSVDFRAVHLGDHESGHGAPNVDNHASGSTLSSYLRPADR